MNKIGLLTIGQSPRVDITPSIQKAIGDHVTIIERGTLDGLSHKEIEQLQPTESEVDIYVTRLRNGDFVNLSKQKLMPYIQRQITSLEKEVAIILILCTGDFRHIKGNSFILYPDRIVKGFVQSILKDKSIIGVIAPDESQKEMILKKWADEGIEVVFRNASPYGENELESMAKGMVEENVDLIVLDCMGYNEMHKKTVQVVSPVPVILSKTVTANFLKELYE